MNSTVSATITTTITKPLEQAITVPHLLTHPLHTVVYNARKRGEDRASDYFKRTENVAGVKDMRFQALMPDILHWLGITKIDRMLSMSKFVHPSLFFVSCLLSAMSDITTACNLWTPAIDRGRVSGLDHG